MRVLLQEVVSETLTDYELLFPENLAFYILYCFQKFWPSTIGHDISSIYFKSSFILC